MENKLLIGLVVIGIAFVISLVVFILYYTTDMFVSNATTKESALTEDKPTDVFLNENPVGEVKNEVASKVSAAINNITGAADVNVTDVSATGQNPPGDNALSGSSDLPGPVQVNPISPPLRPDPPILVDEPSTRPLFDVSTIFNTKKTKIEITAAAGAYFRVNATAFNKLMSDNGVSPTGTWEPSGKWWKLPMRHRRGDVTNVIDVMIWNFQGTQPYSPATSTPQYHGRSEPRGFLFKKGDILERP